MDINKLKGLTIGDLVARVQALGEQLEPDNPDFANDLALSLVKGLVNNVGDMSPIVNLFGEDNAISSALFPEAEEPVTVTKTTTSVGGLPGDITPEEGEMLTDVATGVNPDDGETVEQDDLINDLLNSDEDADTILAKHGYDTASLKDDPASDENIDKLDNKEAVPNPDEPPAVEDETAAEEAADKPKEEKKEEEKPKEEKPKEEKPKEEKPKEEKKNEEVKEEKTDSPDDTQKNILAGLEHRF